MRTFARLAAAGRSELNVAWMCLETGPAASRISKFVDHPNSGSRDQRKMAYPIQGVI